MYVSEGVIMTRLDDELNKMQHKQNGVKQFDTVKKVEKESVKEDEKKLESMETMYEEQPRKTAKEILKNPSKKGKLKMLIGGRPIDLHALEKFVLFKTDQRTTPTILRYNNAYAALDKAAFKRGGGIGFKKINWTMIIVLILIASAGILFLLFGPQIMEALGGMMGGIM